MFTVIRKLTPVVRRPGFDEVRMLGILCGILGVLAASFAPVAAWEADLGLTLLFRLRGQRPPPAEVVLVSLDRRSAAALGVDTHRLHRWPRELHSRLLERLSRANAEVVVFDMHFHEPRDPGVDQQLATIMSRVGNVVLFEYLRKTGDSGFILEQRLRPLPAFTDAAAGTGPFTLPKGRPAQQYWLFKTGAGEAPSLPVVALHALWQRILARNAATSPVWDLKAHELAGWLRQRARQSNPDAAWSAILPGQWHHLQEAIMALHRGPDSRYLDFYGPPATFTTLPYQRALEDPGDLSNRVVFVGYLEQPFETSQVDSFQTPFPGPDGVQGSGVEIAATAFANLLEQRFPTPPSAWLYLSLLLLWGLITTPLYRLPAPRALPGAVALGAIYLGLATLLFSHRALWLPIVTPLLIQLPVALLGTLLIRYVERQRLQQHLGIFTTPELSVRAASSDGILEETQSLFGVCLSSDASRFTERAEGLPADHLRELLNRYYGLLFPLVEEHGGRVSDVIGDEMLAVWDQPLPARTLREQALDAALAMQTRLRDSRCTDREAAFATKIGLHCGPLVVGSVGAGAHFEYRAVGDVVNTATRIQGLNKQLGTTLLASRAVVANLPGLALRDLGRFQLVGRHAALEIVELRGSCANTGEVVPPTPLLSGFATALRAFQDGELTRARQTFAILADHHGDGPSRFYRDYCDNLPATAAADWNGTVVLRRK